MSSPTGCIPRDPPGTCGVWTLPTSGLFLPKIPEIRGHTETQGHGRRGPRWKPLDESLWGSAVRRTQEGISRWGGSTGHTGSGSPVEG